MAKLLSKRSHGFILLSQCFILLAASYPAGAEPRSKTSVGVKRDRGRSGPITSNTESYPETIHPQTGQRRIFNWSRLRYEDASPEKQLDTHLEAMTQFWTKRMTASAGELDRLETRMKDFGSIKMSAPLLSPPSEVFAFDLTKTSDDYYNSGKSDIQGAFMNTEAIVNSAQLSANVTQDTVIGERMERKLGSERLGEVDAVRDRVLEQKVRGLKLDVIEEEYNADVTKANTETDADKKARALIAAENKRITSLEAMKGDEPTYGDDGVLPEKPAPADLLATPRATLDKLAAASPLTALAAAGSPTTSSRTAIISAAGDNAVEAIFKLLGSPEKYANYKDKVLLFGVVTVSVNPGQKTTQNYSADISVALKYGWQRAKASTLSRLAKARENANYAESLEALAAKEASLRTVEEDEQYQEESLQGMPPVPGNATPLVIAASPLVEQQIVDQSSSYRKQTEFALQLGALLSQAGMKAQADAVVQSLKRIEAEARTRDPIGLVNTYSIAGGTFGFRVSPRMQALTDASSREAKAGRVLGQQSFPALVIVAIDAADYQPRVKREGTCITAVWEPCFSFIQTSRWIPLSGDNRGILSACGPGEYWTEKKRQNEIVSGQVFGVDRILSDLEGAYVPGIEEQACLDPYGSAKNAYSKVSTTSASGIWSEEQVCKIREQFDYLASLSNQLKARWEAVYAHTTDSQNSISIPSEVLVPAGNLLRAPKVFGFQIDKDFLVERKKAEPGSNKPGDWDSLTREITVVGSGLKDLDRADPVQVYIGGKWGGISREIAKGPGGEELWNDNLIKIKVVLTPDQEKFTPEKKNIWISLKMPAPYRNSTSLLPVAGSEETFSGGEYIPIKYPIEVWAKPETSALKVPIPDKLYSDPVIVTPSADGSSWAETKINFSVIGTDLDNVESVELTNGDVKFGVAIAKPEKSVITTTGGGSSWTPQEGFVAPTLLVVQFKLKQGNTEPKGPATMTVPGVIKVLAPAGQPNFAKAEKESAIRIDVGPIRGVVKPAAAPEGDATKPESTAPAPSKEASGKSE